MRIRESKKMNLSENDTAKRENVTGKKRIKKREGANTVKRRANPTLGDQAELGIRGSGK